jgi:hypothetical protein
MKAIVLISVILVINTARVAATDVPAINPPDVLTWPRMPVNQFGCYLEKTFAVKDKQFNCALQDYVNHGDPCQNTDAYYEGPTFPNNQAHNIHPLVTQVDLSWEHGELQAVSLHFKKQLPRAEIIARFHLPNKFSSPDEYQNIMSLDIQNCSPDGNCLIIQGFEHMGAGEVDCEHVK